MDWQRIISTLTDSGWTQERLAKHCGCAQSTISDLARGVTNSPSYALGKELERLAEIGAPTSTQEA